ncbi:MAG: YadA-like family protein, partial [Pasteurella sp.]|nr:YadA-like family protein [Pasteurella sp.]
IETALGINSVASAGDSFAIGVTAKAKGFGSVAIGDASQTNGIYSTSIGKEAIANGKYSIAMGFRAKSEGTHSIAIGEGDVAGGVYSLSIGGRSNISNGVYSNILGGAANRIDGRWSSILGGRDNNIEGGDYNFILGSNSTISQNVNKAVVLGYDSVGVDNAISVGKAGNEHQIKHLKKGEVSDTSTDAINGSQVTRIESSDGSVSITEVNADNVGRVYDIRVNSTNGGGSSLVETVTGQGDIIVSGGTTPKNKTFTVALSDSAKGKLAAVDNKADKNAGNLGTGDVTAWKAKLGVEADTNSIETVTGTNGIEVTGGTTTKDKAFTVGLDTATTNKLAEIDGKADKNAGNLDAGDVTAWKQKLGITNINVIDLDDINDAVTTGTETAQLSVENGVVKAETGKEDKLVKAGNIATTINTALNTAKETVTSTDGSVGIGESKNSNGAKEFNLTVNTDDTTIEKGQGGALKVKDGSIGSTQLDSATNTTLAKVGAGEVTKGDTNTVTGDKIFTAVEAAKETVSLADNSGMTLVEGTNATGGKDFKLSVKTDDVTIGKNANGALEVLDGSISESKLDKTLQDKINKIDSKIAASDISDIQSNDGSVKIGPNANVAKGIVDLTVNVDGKTVEKGEGGALKVKDGSIGATQLDAPTNTTLAKVGAGNVKKGDTNTVTGDKVFTAVEAAKETVTVADNGALQLLISKNETGANNFDLSVKTDDKTVVKDANGALKVNEGSIGSTHFDMPTNKTLAKVAKGTVVKGNEGTVTGDTVFDAIQLTKETVTAKDGTVKLVESTNATGAKNFDVAVNIDNQTITKDGQGVLSVKDASIGPKQLTATINTTLDKVGNGQVVEGDTNTVTGDTVFKAIKKAPKTKLKQGKNTVLTGNGAENNPYTVSVSDALEDMSSITFKSDKDGKGLGKITGLEDGKISATSTDAVNGSQLHAINQRVVNMGNKVNLNTQNITKNSSRITHLETKVDKLGDEIAQGVAVSSAIGSLAQPFTAGRSMVSVSVGNHKGEQALAVGYSRISDNGHHIVKFSGATDVRSGNSLTTTATYGYQW